MNMLFVSPMVSYCTQTTQATYRRQIIVKIVCSRLLYVWMSNPEQDYI